MKNGNLSDARDVNEVGQRQPSPKNTLNDLTGREWVFNTNSIESFESTEAERDLNKFIIELLETGYSTSGKESYAHKIRKVHPSPKPPQLMERLINFFSKKGELIFDPFVGVGGTLLGASLAGRKAIGLDISEKYLDVYRQANDQLLLNEQQFIVDDARNLDNIPDLDSVEFDLILTDPPYGNMMARKKTGEAVKKRQDTAPTPFTDLREDIGNLDLDAFLLELKDIISKSVARLKDKRYLVLFTKDFQPKADYHGMLHFDIMTTVSGIENLAYKGMKIWYDKTVNLYPYGYPYAYVGNQLHQYILIFRKELPKVKKTKK
ncbi:MAG: DNA methylase [Acidobacteria bacterium]|nr:DNA methylase [Acidobacteriota bacterium]